MNESVAGVVLGVVGVLGVTYVAVKVRQNQRRLHRMVGIIDRRHTSEIDYLFGLAESGQLVQYGCEAAAPV